MKLAPGTAVIHPQHGLATITEITEREVGGKTVEYLVLERPEEHLVLHVPMDQYEEIGLRKVVAESEIADVLAVLGEESDAADAQWRGLRAKNEARLASGEPRRIAAVVRDLTARSKERDLSMTDRRLLDKARERLINEIGEVMEDGRDIAAMLDEALEA